MFNQKNVAFVITDPQVEFLKSTGKGFGATKDVLEKVNTIENLTKLFALAKERGYKRFISPHYFYPHDHKWQFKAAGENIYYIPGQALSAEIDFDLIKQNFAQFEALQKAHKVTSASAVKYGGVLESLTLAIFGNHIGAEVILPDLETALTAQLGGFVFTSPEEIAGVEKIGQTKADFTLLVNGVKLDGDKLDSAFQDKLEAVYPTEFAQAKELAEVPAVTSDTVIKAKETIEKPVVYIPVFPGTNSEYDSAKAFEKEGAEVNLVPFVTLNEEAIVKSVETMVDNIGKANILFFAGGFSAADEPDGSAKFIVNILLNEKVKKAIDAFIARGGLIIGICNGFQALVKSGLLPYGNFEEAGASSPTLFYNDANQHVAKMVETRIANTNSPWLAGVQVGDIHAIPVSHGEGKFVVTAEEFAELRDNGQIWSQYVDFDGQPSMDSKYNPNGSLYAVRSITGVKKLPTAPPYFLSNSFFVVISLTAVLCGAKSFFRVSMS